MTAAAENRRRGAQERDNTLYEEYRVALTVPCVAKPHGCEVPAGEDCRNLRTDERMGPPDSYGRRPSSQAAHRQRITNGQRRAAEQSIPEQTAPDGQEQS